MQLCYSVDEVKLTVMSVWSCGHCACILVHLFAEELGLRRGGGAVKYKTVSMPDHSFSKHPLNKDFFHAKVTPLTRIYLFIYLFILTCFSLKIWPLNKDLRKNLSQKLSRFLKKYLLVFLEKDCFWYPKCSPLSSPSNPKIQP